LKLYDIGLFTKIVYFAYIWLLVPLKDAIGFLDKKTCKDNIVMMDFVALESGFNTIYKSVIDCSI
jgi:hypothetical protein